MGLGPRTPALIISPWTKAGDNPEGGSIDSTVYEFSSVLRFIEDLHGLKPMTDRDGQADPLSGAFDFEQEPRLEPLIIEPRTARPDVARRHGAPRDRDAIVLLLVAASDPTGDVAGCGGSSGAGTAPDLVDARGEIVELGTSARWTLTFAEPLTVPDAFGRPFRVDIAIRDPDVPPLSFAYYRGVNRLVRVDATVAHETGDLPPAGTRRERVQSTAHRGRDDDDPDPGRTLSADEDPRTPPGLEALRWTVIVRDGRARSLGNWRPTERFGVGIDPVGEDEPAADARSGLSIWWFVAGMAVATCVSPPTWCDAPGRGGAPPPGARRGSAATAVSRRACRDGISATRSMSTTSTSSSSPAPASNRTRPRGRR